MNKKVIWAILVAVISVVGLVGYFAVKGSKSDDLANQTTQTNNTSAEVTTLTGDAKFIYSKPVSDRPDQIQNRALYIDDAQGAGPVSTGIQEDAGYLSVAVAKSTGRAVYVHSQVTNQSTGEGVSSLYVYDPGKSPIKILTLPEKSSFGGIAVSGDGTVISFTKVTASTSTKTAQISVINADGTGIKEVLATAGGLQYGFYYTPGVWSADQASLLLNYGHDGTDAPIPQKLVQLNLATGKLETIFEVSGSRQLGMYTYSPDGLKAIVKSYIRGQGNDNEMYSIQDEKTQLIDIKTKKITDLTASITGNNLAWSLDSKYVTFQSISTADIAEGGSKITSNSLKTIEVATGKMISTITLNNDTYETDFRWLGSNHLVFVETIAGQPNNTAALYTVKLDGTDKKLIDSAIDFDIHGTY